MTLFIKQIQRFEKNTICFANKNSTFKQTQSDFSISAVKLLKVVKKSEVTWLNI